MRKILVASIAALGIASAANAQDNSDSNAYVGLGGSVINFDTGAGDVTLGAANLVAGYNFNENFGIEVEGAVGVADDDILGVDVSLNYLAIVYAVGRLPIGENGSNIYGRVGYGTAEADVGGIDASSDGFAAGFGGEWTPDGSNFIRLDVTALDEDVTQFGAFYLRRF